MTAVPQCGIHDDLTRPGSDHPQDRFTQNRLMLDGLSIHESDSSGLTGEDLRGMHSPRHPGSPWELPLCIQAA
ncbi:MAG: hypothetical protein AMXMBFR83_16970 [Phycisphaerae bacterium]